MRRSPLLVIFFTVFLDLLGFGLVLPLLAKYGREARYGASDVEIGWLIASYSAMQFLFSPVWGRLSDRVGRRPVLMLSITGSVISHLIFTFAPSLAWLFLSRLLAGVMAANISTAQAYVADVTAPQDRAKGMGMVGAAVGLGFIFGPMLAIGVGRWGQSGIGLTAAALSFLDLLLVAGIVPESLPPERRGSAASAEGRLSRMLRALSSPTIGPPIIILFLVTLAFAALEGTITLFLTDRIGDLTPQGTRVLPEATIGKYLGFMGILVALVQGGLTGRLAKRSGEAPLILAGSVLIAAGLLLLSAGHSPPSILGALAVIALGQGVNVPSVNGLVSRSAAADQQGGILGVTQGFSSLARALGPGAGGWLYGLSPTHTAPYLAGAGIVSLAAILGLATVRSPARPASAGQ